MRERFLILFLLFLSNVVNSQLTNVHISSLDSIRKNSDFDLLNSHDHHWNKMSVERLDKRINRFKSSAYFNDSLSAQEQIDTIQKIYDYSILYRENRSRFQLIEFENHEIKDTVRIDKGAKAICLYEDSSLSIFTGFGIFGGIYFELELQNEQLSAFMIIDEYKEQVFKLNVNDTTLNSSIEIPLESQLIHLDHSPQLYNGEILHGKLEFKSPTFYRSSNLDPYLSKDYYNPNEVNQVYYTGELEFTCKVLEPQYRVDW